ncbi:MAG: nuclear transport factor 2 family protein [Rikenellaceae bacterium]
MRHFLLSIALLFATSISSVYAQTKTVVEVTDQTNEQLRVAMSTAASEMITALNTAFVSKNSVPSLGGVSMNNDARSNALQIWECAKYRCIESEIYQRCLTTSKGYQIRNLPFIMEDGSRQDAVINFTPSGVIDAFYFAIENHKYQDIIKANKSITDLRRRQMILDFLENFRTAYNRKDLALIGSMYSDDVLIITGNVCKSNGDTFSGMSNETVTYVKKNKQQYMTSLASVFAKNAYVNIGFDDIYVMQHPAEQNIYGVTLRQAWNTTNYSDDGWLFLAIEFHTDTEMLIHVRTWQPYMLNGEVFPRSEVFQLGEFQF